MVEVRGNNRNSSLLTEDSVREDLLTNMENDEMINHEEEEKKSERKKSSNMSNLNSIENVSELDIVEKIRAS